MQNLYQNLKNKLFHSKPQTPANELGSKNNALTQKEAHPVGISKSNIEEFKDDEFSAQNFPPNAKIINWNSANVRTLSKLAKMNLKMGRHIRIEFAAKRD